MPAVSLLALTLLALAVARSVQLTPDASSPATTPIKTWPTWLGSILSSGLLLVAAWLSSAELTTHTVQPIIRRAQLSQPVTMRQLATAEQALQRCLRLNPWHAGCAEDLASINLAQARRLGATNPVTRALLFQAQARYQQALSLTPGNARLWLRLAQLNYTLQGPAAAIEPAITSLVVGPAEPQLTFTRVPLLLALYPELNANDQILVRQHLNELWQLLPWQVNGVLQQTPGGRSVYLPRLATLLPNSPEVAHTWQRITQLPFRPASPATRPLGKQPAAR